MTSAIENLQKALQYGLSIRPPVGGFPYLAEALRRAGISKNIWTLPSCQSIYLTKLGPVVSQADSLISGIAEVPPFNKEALIKALRIDQAGESTFPEFLIAAWKAGVVLYVVDFDRRSVTYYSVLEETYTEEYPAVEL